MTKKRLIIDEDYNIVDTVTDEWLNDNQVFDLVNELYEENKEIKQLIHKMLVQIEVDNINTKNTRYWAGIIFTLKEFQKMLQIWKGDFE